MLIEPIIQGMDIYSNILYVKEDFAGLSNMAHRAIDTDKYRPESACIVGNYYSLKGQHEKVTRSRHFHGVHTPGLSESWS